jgi:hypothetical protein
MGDKPHLFQKNNAGRKPIALGGSPNKATKTIKENLQLFVEEEIEVLMKRREEMTISERAKLVTALVGYYIPKRTTVEHTKSMTLPKEVEALTFEQLTAIENIIRGEQPAYKIETVQQSPYQIENGTDPF